MPARVTSFGALELRSSRQRELAQAVPRPARLRYFVVVDGTGEARLTLTFGAFLLEEPTVSYGLMSQVAVPTLGMPLATAVVLGYLIDQYGIYTGADIGFRVDSNMGATSSVKFSLTFEAAATRTTNLPLV